MLLPSFPTGVLIQVYDWFVDCPQVTALHNYSAQQPDELSLYEGDVINVLKKLPDGEYNGENENACTSFIVLIRY